MKRIDEENAIHQSALSALNALGEYDPCDDAVEWIKAGKPLLTDEAKEALENVDARRESLAQEIREGLRVRGLWTPDRASDLISAIFSAIDGTEED